MIIRISRKILWFLLIIIVIIAIIGFLPFEKIKNAMSNSADFTFSSNTVVIDPGHGGIDPGAIGINGCDEKDINLNIALCLRDILTANGYKVIMTREEDIAIHDKSNKRISKIKTSDLKKRLQIVNENSQAISIMIHQNHFTQEKYSGAQMFYGKNNPQSKILAEALRKSFKDNLQPQNERQIKSSSKDVYVLHNAKSPIVLAECGFLSNSKEAKLLCDEEYQKKVAFTIFSGIVQYKISLSEAKENQTAQ